MFKQMHQLVCDTCNGPISLWGTKDKKILGGCKECAIVQPLSVIVGNQDIIPFGKPKNVKDCNHPET